MTPEQNPKPDPNSTPADSTADAKTPSEPKTVEAKVVESTTESSKTTAAPKSAAPQTASSDALDQAKAVAAELWRQAKPVLQKVGTQALLLGNRATDFLLDKAFPTAKEKFIQVLPADFKAKVQEKTDPVKEKVVPIWQKVWPWLQKNVGPLWAKAIAFIRSKLPQDLSGQLSDRFLNILVVTAIYLVWSFFSGLTHPSQAKQPESDLTFPEVKNQPSVTAPERPKPLPKTTPTPEPKVAAPKPAPAPPPKVEPKPAVPPAPKPPVSTVPPAPKPAAPTPAPKPIETVKKPEPVTPKPELTTPKPEPIAPKTTEVKPPESKAPVTPVPPAQPVKSIERGPDLVALKADLVQSVDRVVDEAAAMIGKVSVKNQQVKVELGDRWYQLTEQEQSKLADNLFSKSKKLDYERLDLRDAKGEQVARSPYIGSDMIILKRSLPKPQSSESTSTTTNKSTMPPSSNVNAS